MGLQSYKRIVLIYFFGGQCVEAFEHPTELAVEAVWNLNEDELGELQKVIRKRKRDLKEGREILVGRMRPQERK
jgi:hypothetical protein